MADLLVSNTSLQWIVLLLAGAVAGFVNVVAGGGSLLTVPALIFLGLPETVANGTSRVALVTQSISAIYVFARAGQIDRTAAVRLSPPAVLGAVCGAYLAARMSDAGFRAIFGWVMLACAALVVLNPRLGRKSAMDVAAAAPPAPLLIVPAMFAIGVYAGAVQASVGYLWLVAFAFLLRLDLVQANVMKVVMTAVCTVPALAVFAWQGKIDLGLGFVLAVGQAFGAWLGAAATLARGERFIRLMLGLVVLASGLKLLFG